MFVFSADRFKMVLKVRKQYISLNNITKFNTDLYGSTGSWQSSSNSLEIFPPLNGLSSNNLIYVKQFNI